MKQSVNKHQLKDWSLGVLRPVFAPSQRARILTAARPVFKMIRAVIAARKGIVHIVHVRAHTGGSDFDSRMNERADVLANQVRVRYHGRAAELPLDIYGEERFTMRIGLVPVLGSFRDALLREFGRLAVKRWADARDVPVRPFVGPLALAPRVPDAKHSSRLVASNATGVLGLARVVRRAHDPWLLRFTVLLLAEWLPVERRLFVSGRAPGRSDGCKLCLEGAESVRHVPACSFRPVAEVRRAGLLRALDVLRCAGVRVVGPCPRAPAVPVYTISGLQASSGLQTGYVMWFPVWFDVSRAYWMEVLVSSLTVSDPVKHEDPFAMCVGVLPSGLDRFLRPVRAPGGGTCWVLRELRELEVLRQRIQYELVTGALHLYRTRCRHVRAWWSSPRASVFRQLRVQQRARRVLKRRRENSRSRQWAAERKRRRRRGPTAVVPVSGPVPRVVGAPSMMHNVQDMFRPERPRRSSSRVPVRRDFFAPMVDSSVVDTDVVELNRSLVGVTGATALPWF